MNNLSASYDDESSPRQAWVCQDRRNALQFVHAKSPVGIRSFWSVTLVLVLFVLLVMVLQYRPVRFCVVR